MKKLFLLCSIFVILTGCSKEKLEDNIKEEPIYEEEYIDQNDIKLGIYKYYNNKFNYVRDHSDNWLDNQDISYYTIFYSQEEEIITNSFKDDFLKRTEGYTTKKVKHGFNFKFNTIDGEINKTILNPDDVWDIFPYIQIYLYDDIFHANDSWYSHTEQEEVNENTLFTTFKITMGDSSKILSEIQVTAFTYDSDDDFVDRNYRGESYYTFSLGKL